MFSKFIHLHAHSEYSLDVGYFNIADYIRYCYKNKFCSAVITERFNLFSTIKFYDECINFGIKPIIGCEIFLEENDNSFSKLILLCKNFLGYKSLTKIISQSYFNLKNGIPLVKKEWLPFESKNLIAIGISFESDIGKALIKNNVYEANNLLNFWNKSFKDSYYLSITQFKFPLENLYIEKLYNFKNYNKLNLVATNEVCFLKKNEYFSYKTKITMLKNQERINNNIYDINVENKYFKTAKEMYNLFQNNTKLLYNSLEIAKKCNIKFNFKKSYAPTFPKNNKNLSANILKRNTINELILRLNKIKINYWNIYIKRLAKEIKTINSVGFADYFLITSDFIKYAKNNNIIVGPGRGSGSGSLITHLIEISNINPIDYNLLFERFLNKYRISKPDFDIDFCIETRDIITDYIFDLYKIKNVAQIITFGVMAAKAAIRDIGRVLGYPYFFIDKIVKAISNNFGISIKSEIIENKLIKNEYNNSYDVQTILNLGLKVEGVIKNIGKHAGGLIISNTQFTNLLPTMFDDEEEKLITHFDKNDAENIGFSKFDFLGLKTLSIINAAIENINIYLSVFNEKDFDIYLDITENNYKTIKLFQRGDTLGIFQLDSYGIKSIIQKIKPQMFSDIVALIALYRPGPLQSGMLTTFIKRKNGIEKINYPHPLVAKILDETYGMLVYQEQVMLIAQIISSYDIGFSDFLRIAMSKKNKDDIKTHFEIFTKGAISNNISKEASIEIFNLIEKFAGYGFNKAHSVGYGILTYQSGWLKANYNIFFLASLISSDMENYENTFSFINDAKYFSIGILQPDINRSFYPFTILSKNKIRYGLGTIKGLGKIVINEIINNRSTFGNFNTFFDFLYRINIDMISKKVLEALVYSGSFNKINIEKFKLVLISAKVFDLYTKIKNFFFSEQDFINKYFNYQIKNFSYILNYKKKEIKETISILSNIITKNIIKSLSYEIKKIKNLKYIDKKYSYKIECGIIKNILVKKYNIEIEIESWEKKLNLNISYYRYKSLEQIIKKNNIITIGFYEYKKKNYELFIEDFFLFRYKFMKKIIIILTENYITNNFLKKLYKIFKEFKKGCTKIEIKIPIKGEYKKIILKNNHTIYLHSDNISNLLKFKEIKGLIYKFIF